MQVNEQRRFIWQYWVITTLKLGKCKCNELKALILAYTKYTCKLYLPKKGQIYDATRDKRDLVFLAFDWREMYNMKGRIKGWEYNG